VNRCAFAREALGDALADIAVVVHEDDVRPVVTDELAPLLAHGVGHDDDRPVAPHRADERKAAHIARERQEKPGTVNTSLATDFTPDDFQKLTSRYEIADEDRDIMGRRFHTGEGLWTVDVFVSDYAGNEAHALIYLLTGEGEVRANVLSLDHLRQTLTEAKGWTRTA